MCPQEVRKQNKTSLDVKALGGCVSRRGCESNWFGSWALGCVHTEQCLVLNSASALSVTLSLGF